MLRAGNVSTKPKPHRQAPTSDTLRYEKARISGPTSNPEKLIRASSVLIISAAPVVPTPSSFNRSPNNKPKDGSIDRVQKLTIATPMTAIHPQPPSGGTIFFGWISMLYDYFL
uniref:Uncharacterized protein n=1 Tax=Photinus pyralis TaxID=7054 RepID=A0A1Y1M2S6_PHOPY